MYIQTYIKHFSSFFFLPHFLFFFSCYRRSVTIRYNYNYLLHPGLGVYIYSPSVRYNFLQYLQRNFEKIKYTLKSRTIEGFGFSLFHYFSYTTNTSGPVGFAYTLHARTYPDKSYQNTLWCLSRLTAWSCPGYVVHRSVLSRHPGIESIREPTTSCRIQLGTHTSLTHSLTHTCTHLSLPSIDPIHLSIPWRYKSQLNWTELN